MISAFCRGERKSVKKKKMKKRKEERTPAEEAEMNKGEQDGHR